MLDEDGSEPCVALTYALLSSAIRINWVAVPRSDLPTWLK